MVFIVGVSFGQGLVPCQSGRHTSYWALQSILFMAGLSCGLIWMPIFAATWQAAHPLPL